MRKVNIWRILTCFKIEQHMKYMLMLITRTPASKLAQVKNVSFEIKHFSSQ